MQRSTSFFANVLQVLSVGADVHWCTHVSDGAVEGAQIRVNPSHPNSPNTVT